MSSFRVRLIVEKGEMNETEYDFSERTRCVVGRNDECVPIQTTDSSVSRYHCELDINPPEIVIRDLGSRNGTFINGELIGQREGAETPVQGRARRYGDYPLQSGDVIGLGQKVLLRVLVSGSPAPYATQATGGNAPLDRRLEQARTEFAEDIRARSNFAGHAHRNALAVLDPTVYEIGDIIRSGGMGIVLRGTKRATGRAVAVKLILPHQAADPEMQQRFLREIRIMERLEHPRIVGILEHPRMAGTNGNSERDSYIVIVMDYCDGGTLKDWIKRRGSWPTPKRAVELIIAVLEGLEYAHKQHVVHRDINPNNLLMHFDKDKGRFMPRIADFGLARALDETGMTGSAAAGGTLEFVPRQQLARFKYAEPEVDVWATAAVLYWLLTQGRFPRDFPDGENKKHVILRTNAIPIRERDPNIPAALASVVDATVVDRPQIGVRTAKELRLRLEKILRKL